MIDYSEDEVVFWRYIKWLGQMGLHETLDMMTDIFWSEYDTRYYIKELI